MPRNLENENRTLRAALVGLGCLQVLTLVLLGAHVLSDRPPLDGGAADRLGRRGRSLQQAGAGTTAAAVGLPPNLWAVADGRLVLKAQLVIQPDQDAVNGLLGAGAFKVGSPALQINPATSASGPPAGAGAAAAIFTTSAQPLNFNGPVTVAYSAPGADALTLGGSLSATAGDGAVRCKTLDAAAGITTAGTASAAAAAVSGALTAGSVGAGSVVADALSTTGGGVSLNGLELKAARVTADALSTTGGAASLAGGTLMAASITATTVTASTLATASGGVSLSGGLATAAQFQTAGGAFSVTGGEVSAAAVTATTLQTSGGAAVLAGGELKAATVTADTLQTSAAAADAADTTPRPDGTPKPPTGVTITGGSLVAGGAVRGATLAADGALQAGSLAADTASLGSLTAGSVSASRVSATGGTITAANAVVENMAVGAKLTAQDLLVTDSAVVTNRLENKGVTTLGSASSPTTLVLNILGTSRSVAMQTGTATISGQTSTSTLVVQQAGSAPAWTVGNLTVNQNAEVKGNIDAKQCFCTVRPYAAATTQPTTPAA